MPASGRARTTRFGQARPVDRITRPRGLADEHDEHDRSRPDQQVRPPLRQRHSPSRATTRARASRGTPWPGRCVSASARLVVVAVERARLDRVDAHELAVLHLHADEARAADLAADVDPAAPCRSASKSCMARIAVSRFVRVIEFGSSLCAFIVSLTAWAKISPAMNACAPKPSGVLSYLRKPSSVGVRALVLEGQEVQPHVLALDRAAALLDEALVVALHRAVPDLDRVHALHLRFLAHRARCPCSRGRCGA